MQLSQVLDVLSFLGANGFAKGGTFNTLNHRCEVFHFLYHHFIHVSWSHIEHELTVVESECRKTEEMSHHFQYVLYSIRSSSFFPSVSLFFFFFFFLPFFLFSFNLSPFTGHNFPSRAHIVAFLSSQSSSCSCFTIISILSTCCAQTGLSRAHDHLVLTVSLLMGLASSFYSSCLSLPNLYLSMSSGTKRPVKLAKSAWMSSQWVWWRWRAVRARRMQSLSSLFWGSLVRYGIRGKGGWKKRGR